MFHAPAPFQFTNLQSRAVTQENPTGGKGIACKGRGNGNARKGAPCFRDLAPGETKTLCDIAGPGMIRHIWMTPQAPADRTPELMRSYLIRIYWDDAEYPSVEAPLMDFFGVAHGRHAEFHSPYLGTNNGGRGFNCWFPMPFARRCRITFENDSDQLLPFLFYEVDYTLGDEITEDMGYFHAHFRRENPCPVDRDYVLLDTAGTPGVFVGAVIGCIPKAPGWWGEGEIKFYIDGDDPYPTICGTGVEDYVCCGWGFSPHLAIYTGLTYQATRGGDGPDAWQSLVSLFRFHILDPIYFQSDLRVEWQQIGAGEVVPEEITDLDAQRYHLASMGFRGPHVHPDSERPGELMSNWLYDRSDDYCSTVYWYQRLTGQPLPALPSREQRTADIQMRPWEPPPAWMA